MPLKPIHLMLNGGDTYIECHTQAMPRAGIAIVLTGGVLLRKIIIEQGQLVTDIGERVSGQGSDQGIILFHGITPIVRRFLRRWRCNKS